MDKIIEEIIKLVASKYPTLMVSIGIIVLIGWGIKQYYGIKSYGGLFKNRLFRMALIIVILVTAGYSVVTYFSSRPPTMSGTEGKLRVVVLPFENLTDREMLRDAMALSITDSFLSSNNVIAYNERSRLNGIIRKRGLTDCYGLSDVLKIANSIQADFAVWGTIKKYQREVYYVTVRLVEISRKDIVRPIIELSSNDIFDLQQKIFQYLISKLDNEISADQKQRGDDVLFATNNIEAYEYYIQGRKALLLSTPEGYQAAIRFFENALRFDSEYALAWAGLSSAYIYWGYERSWNNQSYKELYDKALVAAQKAVELNPSLSETHRALAITYAYWLPPMRREAEQEARKAIAINPNDYEAYFAIAKARDGDEEYLLMALQINPDYILAYNWLTTMVYTPQGRLDEAIEASKKILNLNPDHSITYGNLASIYYQKGMVDEAIKNGVRAARMKPDLQFVHLILGYAYDKKQLYEKATAELLRAEALKDDDQYAMSMLAQVYEKMGNIKAAQQQWGKVVNLKAISEEDRRAATDRLNSLYAIKE